MVNFPSFLARVGRVGGGEIVIEEKKLAYDLWGRAFGVAEWSTSS